MGSVGSSWNRNLCSKYASGAHLLAPGTQFEGHLWAPWDRFGAHLWAPGTCFGAHLWAPRARFGAHLWVPGARFGAHLWAPGARFGAHIWALRARFERNYYSEGLQQSQILVQADRPEHFLYSRSVLRSSSVNPYSRFSDHRFSVLHRHNILRRHLFKPRQTAQNWFKRPKTGSNRFSKVKVKYLKMSS